MQMIDIKSLRYEALEQFLKELGEPSYRAKQVFSWLGSGVSSYDEMTNIPKSLREKLKETTLLSTVERAARYDSKDGTVKYIWELQDGQCVESVVMQYHHGRSICISTQVGCRMGCKFCASTLGGKIRNLTAGELLDQVLFAEKDLGERISNVVLMGIGEPFDNYEQVLSFLKNISHPSGRNLGLRHISVSTCGIVDKIAALAEENLPITLLISLHAPNDELRNELMPVNHKYPMETLLQACRAYISKTGRRISFEYTMIRGINDFDWCAKMLAQKLHGMFCHVNLIPVNHVEENGLHRSEPETVERFQKYLQQHHINTTVRRELGSDISASCGQLRRKFLKER